MNFSGFNFDQLTELFVSFFLELSAHLFSILQQNGAIDYFQNELFLHSEDLKFSLQPWTQVFFSKAIVFHPDFKKLL